MESQRQKWVNLIFVFFSALVAGVSYIAITKIAAASNLDSMVNDFDLWARLGSFVVFLLLGLYLYWNQKANVFMNEVVLEVGRVTWPTKPDTVRATILVIIMVLISGFILGAFDSFCVWAIQFIL